MVGSIRTVIRENRLRLDRAAWIPELSDRETWRCAGPVMANGWTRQVLGGACYGNSQREAVNRWLENTGTLRSVLQRRLSRCLEEFMEAGLPEREVLEIAEAEADTWRVRLEQLDAELEAEYECEQCEGSGWTDDSLGGVGPMAYSQYRCPACRGSGVRPLE